MQNNRNIDKKRHLAKTITWRIIASLITFVIAYIVTGSFKFGTSVTLFDFFIKMIIYYYHERIWYNFDFGISHKRRIIKTKIKLRKIKLFFK